MLLHIKRWPIGLIIAAVLSFSACAPTTAPLTDPENGDPPAGIPVVSPSAEPLAPPLVEEMVDENEEDEAVEEAPLPQQQDEAATPNPRETVRPALTATPLAERVPATEIPIPVTGEAPEALLNRILEDLAGRLNVDPPLVDYTVVRAEDVVWNDGSLGCPEPDMMYTQALVPGYRIVVEFQGETFDYRTSGEEFFRLCENTLPASPSAPAVTPTE